jgi:putative transposase
MPKSNNIIQEPRYDSEIQQLRKAMKENKDLRMHTRYLAVYNHFLGYQNIEIAKMINLCPHTVGTYINNYKSKGLAGLVMGKSSGAPRKLTREQEQELAETIITKTPDEVGFTAEKNWTTTIIRKLVKKNYGKSYCQRGMLEVLYRLNLSFSKPTYTLEKANPEKQAEFKQEFELLKKSY